MFLLLFNQGDRREKLKPSTINSSLYAGAVVTLLFYTSTPYEINQRSIPGLYEINQRSIPGLYEKNQRSIPSTKYYVFEGALHHFIARRK